MGSNLGALGASHTNFHTYNCTFHVKGLLLDFPLSLSQELELLFIAACHFGEMERKGEKTTKWSISEGEKKSTSQHYVDQYYQHCQRFIPSATLVVIITPLPSISRNIVLLTFNFLLIPPQTT